MGLQYDLQIGNAYRFGKIRGNWAKPIVPRRVWRYQRDNQNPYMEEEQTTQWPKEKVQNDKQWSTKHTLPSEIDWLIDWFVVLSATFSNVSAILWRPVLVVEEAGVPEENHRPWPSEIESRRKELYPIMKRAKTEWKHIKMVRNKLFIDGELYVNENNDHQAISSQT